MMTKKDFFKFLATVLLMPGGVIFAAVVVILFAALVGVAIYVACFIAMARWAASSVDSFISSFRKAKPAAAPLPIPEIYSSAYKSEAQQAREAAHNVDVWNAREAAHRKWLQ